MLAWHFARLKPVTFHDLKYVLVTTNTQNILGKHKKKLKVWIKIHKSLVH